MAAGVGDDRGLIHKNGFFRFDCQDGRPGLDQFSDGDHPDRGNIEPHVLLRFGDFDQGESTLRAQFPGAADAGVGAFDRFDRQHRSALDRDALAHVQAAHLAGQMPTELDVLPLARAGFTAGQVSWFHEQLRDEIGGGSEMDAVFGEFADDGQQQRIILAVLGAADPMRIERAYRSPIGQMFPHGKALEQQDFVDLAGHRRPADAARTEVADGLAQFAEPDLPIVRAQ
jgi:hypothetical protein